MVKSLKRTVLTRPSDDPAIGHNGSSSRRLAGTDDGSRSPEENVEHSDKTGAVPKPMQFSEPAVDSVSAHPGQIVERKDIVSEDLQWRDIGSGTFAKTIRGATKLVTTTRSGPTMSDIDKRTTWSLSTGQMIDECVVDDVRDTVLHRE